MEYIDDNILGGKLRPVRNNHELTKAMYGRKNCIIYTVGTFKIREENILLLELKNITLVALAFAQLKHKKKKKKQEQKFNIIVDEIHELPLSIKLDIDVEQKNRYINGGM